MRRLYFVGLRSSLLEFAHQMKVPVSKVVHIRSTLHVKQVVPGAEVYASCDSLTSATLCSFCKERGNMHIKNWNAVEGQAKS